MLERAGIQTALEFRKLGAVNAFSLLRAADKSLGLEFLWRLESAIADIPLIEISAERRAEMLRAIGGRPRPVPRHPP